MHLEKSKYPINVADGHVELGEHKLRLPAACLVAKKKARSNLGPSTDELGPKPTTMTQNKGGRTNEIDFLQLPWAQEASGSNPDAPTILLIEL